MPRSYGQVPGTIPLPPPPRGRDQMHPLGLFGSYNPLTSCLANMFDITCVLRIVKCRHTGRWHTTTPPSREAQYHRKRLCRFLLCCRRLPANVEARPKAMFILYQVLIVDCTSIPRTRRLCPSLLALYHAPLFHISERVSHSKYRHFCLGDRGHHVSTATFSITLADFEYA